ncbi:MAG: glycosyl hydrolase family 28-related protein [Armatimonadota bacterium]
MQNTTVISILAAIILIIASCSVFAQTGVFVVTKFGAMADGITDDTDAFLKAIEAASKYEKGAKIIVPAGKYRLTKPLTLEAVLLTGLDTGAWPSDIASMPTINVDHTEKPCIIAKNGASINGLNFDYAFRQKNSNIHAPTIQLSGIGVSITNVRMQSPYEGIVADGTSNVGRLNIENVFIVSAQKTGVFVTGTWDIPTIRNVEVWNICEYSQRNSTGFKFGYNDEMRLTDCFAFACKIGYHFIGYEQEPGKIGGSWGGMTGCSADFCGQGVVIEKAVNLRIVGGSFWAHGNAIRVAGEGRVTISGSDLKGNGAPALVVDDCTSLTVTGCGLGKAGESWAHIPNARINNKSGTVLLNACTFDQNSIGVEIGEDADNFSIANNVFAPSPYESIIDNSANTANKIINNNLMKKIEQTKEDTK